ncbi:MAG TPA: BamA/TamA family outer membrane protein [Chitinophagaceae bacterium]
MIFSRKPIFLCTWILLAALMFQSCIPYKKNKFLFVFNRISVKHPPKDTSTPFVFGNEIEIQHGVISKDEENRLESELDTYWDDTIKAKSVQQFGIFYRIKNPQRFDTIGLARSRYFMNSYLQSQGYYHAQLKDTFRIDTFHSGRPSQQYRVTPVMYINPGKRLRFDSLAYQLVDTLNAPSDSVLHRLALRVQNESLLKKNDPYSKQVIASELDRLISWFREHGYYRINREHLAALVDTTDQLIDSLIIDPFELARRTAEAAERRRQFPTADVTIMQATQAKDIPFDTTVLTRYYIGNVHYYPQTNAKEIPDSILLRENLNQQQRGNVSMKYPGTKPQFELNPLERHTYLTKGSYYDERLYFRTLNAMAQMGPWQQVDVRDSVRNDTVDFHIFLTPHPKQRIKADFELTRSTGDFASSNNLFGIGGNLTYLHRNVGHKAIQFAPFVRAGVELNLGGKEKLLQTTQFGTGLAATFPRLLFIRQKKEKTFDGARTVLNLNGSYTDRFDFFRLRSFTVNLSWEYRRGAWATTIKPNVELYGLDTLKGLKDAFNTNPFLRNAFNTGSVAGFIITHNRVWVGKGKAKTNHQLRFGVELAGLPVWVESLYGGNKLRDNYYNYGKLEAEWTMRTQRRKTTRVGRLFMGIGYNFSSDPKAGKTLPFFKQFIAGGPNSMRAWGLRQLGLGSSVTSESAPDFKDRFGDLQLEANYEFRFPVWDFGGAKLSSALFADAGNIWNLKEDPADPKANFDFKRFFNGDDIAIAAGIGLMRLNVANFILRVDLAYKLKDPVRKANNGWPDLKNFWKNEYGTNNYAFQIGIGMPFYF